MTYLNWSIGSFLLVTFFLVLLRSSTQESFAFASPRCLSICRRDEESLCKMCLFREPMRFGKRSSVLRELELDKRGDFRSPMRFGKKWESIRGPMRFGKRQESAEMLESGIDSLNNNYSTEKVKCCNSPSQKEAGLEAMNNEEVRYSVPE